VLALWFAFRSKQPVVRNEVAILDLRGQSVERGEQNPPDQAPLKIGRSTRRLVLYLPIGSKEGSYDVAMLSETGGEGAQTSGIAQIENHVLVLRADIDLAGVPPGSYVLGLRQRGLKWTRFPVRVL